eukprot:CAMPEP_0168413522 /NCGR_PEP_ID=MMETSP0228-20121227/29262_1 /TAXON_ID=133427 /ORGANISM="Protoceratium reticulatum, Strain CCCM 535 (=CCMP 1889)" /LENGTH=182 /DNA_ID=CAMNT_0008427307 /DNA_START=64 /DNA_END=609 /DNA_ORIENTATION=-
MTTQPRSLGANPWTMSSSGNQPQGSRSVATEHVQAWDAAKATRVSAGSASCSMSAPSQPQAATSSAAHRTGRPAASAMCPSQPQFAASSGPGERPAAHSVAAPAQGMSRGASDFGRAAAAASNPCQAPAKASASTSPRITRPAVAATSPVRPQACRASGSPEHVGTGFEASDRASVASGAGP